MAVGPIVPDPIYDAIERHKAAGTIFDAAVTVRSRFPDMDMNDEQVRQLERVEEAVATAWDPSELAGVDLINTEPTTLAGVIAAIQYVRIQMRNDGRFVPHDVEFEYDSGCEDDGGETLGCRCHQGAVGPCPSRPPADRTAARY
jgi:hypothetical protein